MISLVLENAQTKRIDDGSYRDPFARGRSRMLTLFVERFILSWSRGYSVYYVNTMIYGPSTNIFDGWSRRW